MNESEVRRPAAGTLYVVATPIGNLSDLSERALLTLRSVSAILAEDTRVFGTLAKRCGIETPRESFFEHNERRKLPEVLERLKAGESFALVTDAGTPTVSDPGYRLVHACREEKIPVSPIPGPSAAVAALSVCGLPTDRFFFEGFLPQKPGRKKKRIEELLALETTVICFESPHRIAQTIETIAECSPQCRVFVGRELTKLYEECVYGSAAELQRDFSSRPSIKGEMVIAFSPSGSAASEHEPQSDS